MQHGNAECTCLLDGNEFRYLQLDNVFVKPRSPMCCQLNCQNLQLAAPHHIHMLPTDDGKVSRNDRSEPDCAWWKIRGSSCIHLQICGHLGNDIQELLVYLRVLHSVAGRPLPLAIHDVPTCWPPSCAKPKGQQQSRAEPSICQNVEIVFRGLSCREAPQKFGNGNAAQPAQTLVPTSIICHCTVCLSRGNSQALSLHAFYVSYLQG